MSWPRWGLRFFAFLHAVFLIFLTFYWHKQPYLYDEELTLIRISSFLKRLVLKIDEKPDLNKYLFIDISWERQLVDKSDAYGFPIGKEAVTDRNALCQLFGALNNMSGKPKFVVCDIFFDVPTDMDACLVKNINALKGNILCTSLYDFDNDSLIEPLLDIPTATTSFETADGVFLKTKLKLNNEVEILPVKMHESIRGEDIKTGDYIEWGKGLIHLNTFVVDHAVRSYDLFDGNVTNKLYLSEMLFLDSATLESIMKDKIIFIGDFENNDIVETIYGDMPGPIVLLNTFFAIENGDHTINIIFILYLLLGYFLISYICFSEDSIFDRLTDNIAARLKINADLLSFGGYLIYFFLMSLISYLIFNFLLTILLFSLYMEIFEKVKDVLSNRIKAYFLRSNS